MRPANTPPPPMRDIAPAMTYIPDAIESLQRAGKSWNRTQLAAHLDTAEAFIRRIRAVIDRAPESAKASS